MAECVELDPNNDDGLMLKSINNTNIGQLPVCFAVCTVRPRVRVPVCVCIRSAQEFYISKETGNKICPSIINEKNHKMEFRESCKKIPRKSMEKGSFCSPQRKNYTFHVLYILCST